MAGSFDALERLLSRQAYRGSGRFEKRASRRGLTAAAAQGAGAGEPESLLVALGVGDSLAAGVGVAVSLLAGLGVAVSLLEGVGVGLPEAVTPTWK